MITGGEPCDHMIGTLVAFDVYGTLKVTSVTHGDAAPGAQKIGVSCSPRTHGGSAPSALFERLPRRSEDRGFGVVPEHVL
jgi:hypothetical protein